MTVLGECHAPNHTEDYDANFSANGMALVDGAWPRVWPDRRALERFFCERLGRWDSAGRSPRSTLANPAASSGTTARNPTPEGAIARRSIWRCRARSRLPEWFSPSPTPPTANPSGASPEINSGTINSSARSGDQQAQGDEQRPLGVHQNRRCRPDARRIRRLRECISNHEYAEQHRHQFRQHTFQQYSSGKCD